MLSDTAICINEIKMGFHVFVNQKVTLENGNFHHVYIGEFSW